VALKSWQVDDKGLAELGRDPALADLLRQAGQRGYEAAYSLAPVRTGTYRDTLQALEPAPNDDGVLQGGFGSDSPIWHIVEYGSAHNQPYRVLSNAYMAITGGRYDG
jgi:hypothetical protein